MSRILIVDDEKDILEFLGYNLRKEGYEVFESKNGEDAILLAKKAAPELIILDVMMPGIDGIENSFRISTISVDFDKKYSKLIKVLKSTI